jgi:hypothetical protein
MQFFEKTAVLKYNSASYVSHIAQCMVMFRSSLYRVRSGISLEHHCEHDYS